MILAILSRWSRDGRARGNCLLQLLQVNCLLQLLQVGSLLSLSPCQVCRV